MAKSRTLGLALGAAMVLGSAARAEEREAKVSLDLKDAPAVDIVTVLTEAAGFQAGARPTTRARTPWS